MKNREISRVPSNEQAPAANHGLTQKIFIKPHEVVSLRPRFSTLQVFCNHCTCMYSPKTVGLFCTASSMVSLTTEAHITTRPLAAHWHRGAILCERSSG